MTLRWLVLSLLILQEAPRKEVITLKFSPRAGDRIRFEDVRSMVLKDPPMIRPPNAKGGNRGDYTLKVTMRGVQEFVDVKDGRPLRKTVDITEALTTDQMPWEKEPVVSKAALHQRKVTILLDNGKLAHQGVHGLDERSLAVLTMNFANEYVELLPPEPVRIGDFWKVVDKNPLGREDNVTFETGFVFLTLKDIRVVEGRRCAVISFDQETSSLLKPRGRKDSLWIDVVMKGELVVWIDRGFLVSLSVSGGIKMKLKKGAEETEGEGENTIEVTSTIEPAPEK